MTHVGVPPGWKRTTAKMCAWNPQGRTGYPVYNILEATCNIVLPHPKYVMAIREKTDEKDAKWSIKIFKHDLLSGSFIPFVDIHQLRDLMRYHWKLTNFTTGEKNRVQKCLIVSNIKLDVVFSNVFGKAASAITTQLLESKKPFDVTSYLTKGIETPVKKYNPLWAEKCVLNRPKSSASSTPTWISSNYASEPAIANPDYC